MGKAITLRQKGNETCPNTTDALTWEIYTEIIVNEKKDQINCSTSINVINQCHMTQSHITQSNKILKMRNGMDLKPLGTTCMKVKKVKNPKTQKKYCCCSWQFNTPERRMYNKWNWYLCIQITLLQFHPHRGRCAKDVRNIKTADLFSRNLGTLPSTIHLQID